MRDYTDVVPDSEQALKAAIAKQPISIGARVLLFDVLTCVPVIGVYVCAYDPWHRTITVSNHPTNKQHQNKTNKQPSRPTSVTSSCTHRAC